MPQGVLAPTMKFGSTLLPVARSARPIFVPPPKNPVSAQ
jgi:hypothetical protein